MTLTAFADVFVRHGGLFVRVHCLKLRKVNRESDDQLTTNDHIERDENDGWSQ